MRGYLNVVSIPTAATVDPCLPTTILPATRPFCLTLRQAQISRLILSFILAAIAGRRGPDNIVAKPPEWH
jgi:hypothetical protein